MFLGWPGILWVNESRAPRTLVAPALVNLSIGITPLRPPPD
jgi:hypothetical protein